MANLTGKEERFVELYIIDFNGTKAAREAGYSAKTAAQAASRLLKKVKIQQAIAQAIENRSKRTEVDQDWVVERLVRNVERASQAEPVLPPCPRAARWSAHCHPAR